MSEFPADAPAADLDPVSFDLPTGPVSVLNHDVLNLVGIRFVPAGRISWYDAGDQVYTPGDRVVVDAERGRRLAWIATAARRAPLSDRGVRRVLRRAEGRDLQAEGTNDASQSHALRVAKDAAAALKLPLKVFRVEIANGKFLIYYTSD
jgi:cell fate regulator YaaT (PSP1 superfamily)